MPKLTCQTCGVHYEQDDRTVSLSNQFPNNFHLKRCLTFCDVCRKKETDAILEKALAALPGIIGRLALNNLNPNNQSNAVYFEDEKSSFHPNTPSLTKLEEYRGTLRKAIGESTCESTRVKLIGMLQEIENQIKAIGKTLAEPA